MRVEIEYFKAFLLTVCWDLLTQHQEFHTQGKFGIAVSVILLSDNHPLSHSKHELVAFLYLMHLGKV